jgi:hypothetical protein
MPSGAAQQGINVAISGDGDTIASGGFADNNHTGAAYGRLLATATPGRSWAKRSQAVTYAGAARQGASLALSGNGTRLLMGGYQDDNRQGAVRTFNRLIVAGCSRAPSWWAQAVPHAGVAGLLGVAERDGNTAVVGGNERQQPRRRCVGISYAGGSWTQQARLVGTQAAGAARQGYSVSLSADGNMIHGG